MTVYYTYVLKSEVSDFYYKGHCQNLAVRLVQHNSGMTKSIRPYLPFKLIYFEKFESLNEAIRREKYFKTSAGRRYLSSKLIF
ncbi:GIY-YIG nuclease family protein [Daejeonella sp.]|uniref:GIY-YIG nuclease family protein n=1 Tax=Daejeonella sp. TaxID=2805397 RepID=UPI0030BE930F